MSDYLRLTLQRDTNGTGELFAEVSVNGFSGVGSAWFNLSQIHIFGESLASNYPLLADGDYSLRGGVWSTGSPDQLSEVNLSLKFYPMGALGEIGCRVDLAGCGLYGCKAAHSVSVELHTHYEQLRRFGLALITLVDGQVNEISL